MTGECGKCGDWIEFDAVEISDELYHPDCAEHVLQADSDYAELMATWGMKP